MSYMDVPTLVLRNLQTRFHTRDGVLPVVDGVSFTLARGKVLGLVGESGSGKSVTGFSIMGLVDPPGRVEGGQVLFQGRDLLQLSNAERRALRGDRIAMIFQDPMATLNPVLRVDTQMIETVQAHRSVSTAAARQQAADTLALMGLSNDWTKLNSKIDGMTPVGNTNQAIGLQVGWQTLTASPFTVPAVDPDYKYQTVIILLTDGLNTEDRWYTSQSSIDTRQQKTCDNIKAASITLYTVQVNTGGDATSTMLQNCASDSSKFFLLTTAGQIVTTFGQIGTSLSKLRLAM